MMEKGVLGWCDDNGSVFGDDLALEKAKRAGKAYLCVAGGNSLPTPFQLTGDPRWDKGGDLWAVYDLELDHSGDSDQASTMTENVISEAVAGNCEFGDSKVSGGNGVKALSGKSDEEIEKMLESSPGNQSTGDAEDFAGDRLFREFNEILSSEGIGAISQLSGHRLPESKGKKCHDMGYPQKIKHIFLKVYHRKKFQRVLHQDISEACEFE